MSTSISLESLLDQDDWLRSLARTLVSDENAAQDLAQETWVTALERPPQEPGNLRGWLRRVVWNSWLGSRRKAVGRERMERLAAANEALPSAAEVVERVALQRKIAGAVLALDATYRDVVLLRFYEGLAPRDIAERMGISPIAVRTRLSRGLAMLRARLEGELGDRRDWRAALAPFFAPPVLIATALAAAFLVLLWIGSTHVRSTDMEPRLPGGHAGTSAGVAASGDPVVVRTEGKAPAKVVASDFALGDEDTWLVRVVDDVTGETVSGAEVRHALDFDLDVPTASGLLLDLESRLEAKPVAMFTDEEGEARVPRPALPIHIGVRTGDRWGYRKVFPGEAEPVEIRVFRQLEVSVSAVDPGSKLLTDSRPLDRVPIVLEGSKPGRMRIAETGSDGMVTLSYAPDRFGGSGESDSCRVGMGVPSSRVRGVPFPASVPFPVRIQFEMPPTHLVLLEALTSEEGPPLADIRVQIVRTYDPNNPDFQFRPGIGEGFTMIGPARRVLIPYIGHGEDLRVRVEDLSGTYRQVEQDVEGPREDEELTIWTFNFGERNPIVRGVAVDAQGEPLANRDLAAWIGYDRWFDFMQPVTSQRIRTDGEGHFSFPFEQRRIGRGYTTLHLVHWQKTSERGYPRGPEFKKRFDPGEPAQAEIDLGTCRIE